MSAQLFDWPRGRLTLARALISIDNDPVVSIVSISCNQRDIRSVFWAYSQQDVPLTLRVINCAVVVWTRPLEPGSVKRLGYESLLFPSVPRQVGGGVGKPICNY